MELLYFISGILTVGTIYGVLLFRQIKSSHTTLLEELHSYGEISRKEFDNILNLSQELKKDIDEVSEYYNSVQEQMTTDAYEGNIKLNQRITDLSKTFNQQGNNNKKLFGVADSQLRKINSDIQILNGALKRFQDDPDLKARY